MKEKLQIASWNLPPARDLYHFRKGNSYLGVIFSSILAQVRGRRGLLHWAM